MIWLGLMGASVHPSISSSEHKTDGFSLGLKSLFEAHLVNNKSCCDGRAFFTIVPLVIKPRGNVHARIV